MRFALYYPYLYLRGGIERTILNQITASRNEWLVFTNHYDREQTFQEFKKFDVKEINWIPVKRTYAKVCIALTTILRTSLPLSDCRALLVHTEGLGDLTTFLNREKPVVAYCHTPLKVIHDDAAKGSYLAANPAFHIPYFLCSRLFCFVDRLAWKHYKHVFCNSDEVRERILRAGLCDRSAIEVLHPGVDTNIFFPGEEYQDYFVLPTRLKWWKNIELAIESFKIFCDEETSARRFKLIIAGQLDAGSDAYYKRLLNLSSHNDRIVLVVNPSEEDFVNLIRKSYAVLNTTLNEDWGLVPLEANACARPVIGVKAGGLVESQTNHETALLVEPTPRHFADAMVELVRDKVLTEKIRMHGRRNALRYSWKSFADRIDTYMESICS